MDCTNKVENFEEVFMFDPTKKSKSISTVMTACQQINFYTQVYPQHVMGIYEENAKEKGSIKPPKCIFLPSKEVIRKMI